MTANLVGIDVSCGQFDAVIELSDRRYHASFKDTGRGLSEFHKWLQKHNHTSPHLFLEATGRYWEPLAIWSRKQGWGVTVCNPRYIRKFADSQGEINKTDKKDAGTVLAFAQTRKSTEIRIWDPPSAAVNQIREIQMVLEGECKTRTANINRSRSGITTATAKAVLKADIEHSKKSQNFLEREALAVIKADEKLNAMFKVITSIKGIGTKTAIVLLARVDFSLFQKGRQLVAFAGLAPRKYQSGKTVKKKDQISRVGHADLRAAMYLPAIVSMTHDPEMRKYKERLEQQGKPKKVIICAIMARLLRTVFALVRQLNKPI